MTRIAIIDPSAGISGDMMLGALLDLGAEESWLCGLPARLGLDGVVVHTERVERASQVATHVRFDVPDTDGSAHGHDVHHGHHRHGHHVSELVRRIEAADLHETVRQRAVRAFELVGEAEGRVHGVAPDMVHLHEVGAADALLDIVGAIEGLHRLGVETVYALPAALGTGWVTAAHGELPVPAPATSILMEGLDTTADGPVEGEATTPTGAALLRVLSEGSPAGGWRTERVGWGAGTRNPATYANVLRILLARTAVEAGIVEVIAADIDDMVPEYLESVRSAIFSAGAVDCVIWPTQSKKGRVGFRIEAQSPPERAEAVRNALLRHTTSLGVRGWMASRRTLPRREIIVEVAPSHPVRVKIWDSSGIARMKPESDDVLQAAQGLGLSALEVADRARELARAELRGSTNNEDTEEMNLS